MSSLFKTPQTSSVKVLLIFSGKNFSRGNGFKWCHHRFNGNSAGSALLKDFPVRGGAAAPLSQYFSLIR